jgi:hypothetical protein
LTCWSTPRLNVGEHLDRPASAEDRLTWLACHDRHFAGSDGIHYDKHRIRVITVTHELLPGNIAE